MGDDLSDSRVGEYTTQIRIAESEKVRVLVGGAGIIYPRQRLTRCVFHRKTALRRCLMHSRTW